MKLRITSIPNFIAFLKKVKAVDKNVILELSKDNLFAKIHTPDKAVMKFVSSPLSDILENSDLKWDKIKGDRVKIGIVDVTRLVESFKHFRPEEDVFLEIKVDNVDNESVATEIKLNSSSLNIKIRCSDLSIMSYVKDEILDVVISKESYLSKFKIYQSDFGTITSLCGLETNSEEILTFEVSENNVYAKGDSFRYKLNIGASEISIEKGEDSLSNLYKKQLSYMESETCDAFVHENRLVLISEQSSTSIAIGSVVK